jgi:hypothetical protein
MTDYSVGRSKLNSTYPQEEMTVSASVVSTFVQRALTYYVLDYLQALPSTANPPHDLPPTVIPDLGVV